MNLIMFVSGIYCYIIRQVTGLLNYICEGQMMKVNLMHLQINYNSNDVASIENAFVLGI